MQPDTLLTENLTNAGVAAALALDHVNPNTTRFDNHLGLPIMLTQPALRVTSLEHLLPAPRTPKIDVALYTKEDLVAYIGQQASLPLTEQSTSNQGQGNSSDNPVIFANRNSLSFTAFLDYHRAGSPSWCRHSVVVAYKDSHQFARWKANNGRKMGQEEFATFLDENVTDIINPTGAEVVTFASHLEVTRTERFKEARNLANGEVNFTFTNESSGDSAVKFPTEMTLSIPLWINGDRIALRAKLFYRVIEGKLTFWYKLMHLEETIDHLFGEDVTWLEEATQSTATVYVGTAPTAPCVGKLV